MIGSIIGDIIGSRFEHSNINSKDFALFHPDCEFTDDTICTIATMDWILGKGIYTYSEHLRKWCGKYPSPMGGYGGGFVHWLRSENPQPYNSFGNGSAMRVSPVALAYQEDYFEYARIMAIASSIVTHSHSEGIKGAEVTTAVIYEALNKSSKEEIKKLVEENYGYDLNRTVSELQQSYRYNETCQGTVPEAIICFLESEDFEDAIRNAVSIGGDSDTLACIVGGMAEAFYGIPTSIRKKALNYLPDEFIKIITKFYKYYER